MDKTTSTLSTHNEIVINHYLNKIPFPSLQVKGAHYVNSLPGPHYQVLFQHLSLLWKNQDLKPTKNQSVSLRGTTPNRSGTNRHQIEM